MSSLVRPKSRRLTFACARNATLLLPRSSIAELGEPAADVANHDVLRREIDEGVRCVDLVRPGCRRHVVIDDPSRVRSGHGHLRSPAPPGSTCAARRGNRVQALRWLIALCSSAVRPSSASSLAVKDAATSAGA